MALPEPGAGTYPGRSVLQPRAVARRGADVRPCCARVRLTLAALAALQNTALPRVVTTGQPVALTAVPGTLRAHYLFDPATVASSPPAGPTGFTVTQPSLEPARYLHYPLAAVTPPGSPPRCMKASPAMGHCPSNPSAPLPQRRHRPAGDLSPATVHDGPRSRRPVRPTLVPSSPGICAHERRVNLTRAPDAPFPSNTPTSTPPPAARPGWRSPAHLPSSQIPARPR